MHSHNVLDERDRNFERVFMWFWSSVNYDKQEAILNFINLDLNSPTPPRQQDAGARPAVKFDGVFEAASWAALEQIFDLNHDYWSHRRLFFRVHGDNSGFVDGCTLHVEAGHWGAEACRVEKGANFESKNLHIMKTSLHLLRWVSRLHRQVSEQRAVISQHTREIGDLWEAVAQLERANAQRFEKL
jgi:hypothetical protein